MPGLTIEQQYQAFTEGIFAAEAAMAQAHNQYGFTAGVVASSPGNVFGGMNEARAALAVMAFNARTSFNRYDQYVIEQTIKSLRPEVQKEVRATIEYLMEQARDPNRGKVAPIPRPPLMDSPPKQFMSIDELVEPLPLIDDLQGPGPAVATDEEVESTGPAAFNYFSPGPMGGVSNPGAGWGGSSPTNEGGFATIDSSGNITNTVTGESIGQSTFSGSGPSNSSSMGGNAAE